MTKRNANVWEDLEPILRSVFPYPYPDDMDTELELADYYEAERDPLIPFLTDEADKKAMKKALEAGIEFVEYNGSFYESVDYDSIPQGTEDECDSIIKVGDQHYRVGLLFTSYSGYRLDEEAYKVIPKTVEVVVYE